MILFVLIFDLVTLSTLLILNRADFWTGCRRLPFIASTRWPAVKSEPVLPLESPAPILRPHPPNDADEIGAVISII